MGSFFDAVLRAVRRTSTPSFGPSNACCESLPSGSGSATEASPRPLAGQLRQVPLSANGPIVRFRDPGDYLDATGGREGCEMRFYCPKTPLTGEQKSDDWIHDHAVDLE